MNQQDRVYAGLLPRFWALLIDFALFVSLFLPATRLIKGVWIMNATDHRWARGLFITDPLCITFLIVMLLYFVMLEGLVGATLGKWMLGLRVINHDDGSKPGLARSLVRNLLRFVDGLPAFSMLGIVLVVRSPQHARFGDRVADTRVIKKSSAD